MRSDFSLNNIRTDSEIHKYINSEFRNYRLRLEWPLRTGFLPSFTAASVYETAIRHRVSPEFIGSRNCVPMAFTAESPPAQGQ